MARVIRTDWQAVNSAGTVLYTFGDPAKGRAWVRANACRHDGLHLQEVQITARRVYRPPSAARRRFDLAISAMPAGAAA